MHTLNRLEHIVTDTEWTIDAKPLVFIDFKLGNICNLKCRICGSWSSSTYATEEVKFKGKNSFHYQMLKDGGLTEVSGYIPPFALRGDAFAARSLAGYLLKFLSILSSKLELL